MSTAFPDAEQKKRERPEKENTHSSESSFLQLLWSQMLTSQNFRPPPPRPQPSSLSCCGLFSRNRSFFGFRLDEIVKNKLCKLSDSQLSHSQEGSGGEGLAYPPPQHPQPHNLLFKKQILLEVYREHNSAVSFKIIMTPNFAERGNSSIVPKTPSDVDKHLMIKEKVQRLCFERTGPSVCLDL